MHLVWFILSFRNDSLHFARDSSIWAVGGWCSSACESIWWEQRLLTSHRLIILLPVLPLFSPGLWRSSSFRSSTSDFFSIPTGSALTGTATAISVLSSCSSLIGLCFRSMEAIPLLNSLSDYRNFYSALFYTSLCAIICKILSRLATDRSLSASCNSCFCSPTAISAKTKSKVSKWNNNNNNVSLHSSSSGSESEAESEVMDSRPATNEPLLMAIILLIFPWLPASNLFFYVGFVVAGSCSLFLQKHTRIDWKQGVYDQLKLLLSFSLLSHFLSTERVLYIPSMGFCLFIATGMEALMKRKTSRFITTAGLIALSILLMSFSGRTFVRNIDWQDEEKLYTSGIPINPPKGIITLSHSDTLSWIINLSSPLSPALFSRYDQRTVIWETSSVQREGKQRLNHVIARP